MPPSTHSDSRAVADRPLKGGCNQQEASGERARPQVTSFRGQTWAALFVSLPGFHHSSDAGCGAVNPRFSLDRGERLPVAHRAGMPRNSAPCPAPSDPLPCSWKERLSQGVSYSMVFGLVSSLVPASLVRKAAPPKSRRQRSNKMKNRCKKTQDGTTQDGKTQRDE